MIMRIVPAKLVLSMGILAIAGHAWADGGSVELPDQCPVLENSGNFPDGSMVGSELAWPRPRWLDSAVDQETSSVWRMAAVKYYASSGFDVSIVSFYREGECFKHVVGGGYLISATPIAIDNRVVVLAVYPAGAASVTVKLFDPAKSTEPVIEFASYGDRVSHRVEDGELVIERTVRIESSDGFQGWDTESHEIRYSEYSGF